MKISEAVRDYMASIGSKGGKQKSDKKTLANRRNAKLRWDNYRKNRGKV